MSVATIAPLGLESYEPVDFRAEYWCLFNPRRKNRPPIACQRLDYGKCGFILSLSMEEIEWLLAFRGWTESPSRFKPRKITLGEAFSFLPAKTKKGYDVVGAGILRERKIIRFVDWRPGELS